MKNLLKKLSFVLIVLTLFPSTSFAEFNWKRVGENTSGTVFYVDKSSVKRMGNTIYFFSMMDYAKPVDGILSTKIYQEGNCSDYSFRYLKDFYYDQPMGNGSVVHQIDEVGKWTANIPGSLNETVFDFLCK
tara:strand:+ start:588 stop:980 length:393 start_codon:yes stop_codon:yes gene_type:complete